MQIVCLPAAPIRASGALTGSLLSELALMRRNWLAGQAAASGSSSCSSTVRTQINKLAAYKATILCLVRTPLYRSELYQLWWRQEFFDRKFILRLGKVAPTDDFNNVLRPVPVQDQHLAIPAVSGLLYTPVFINPTLLGAMPGYYNTAYGITATFTPMRNLYLSYGLYDGNIANHVQTGLARRPKLQRLLFPRRRSGRCLGSSGTARIIWDGRLAPDRTAQHQPSE